MSFLQSMGISIAKHRLEILKLARKAKGKSPRAMARVLVAIKRTKRCLAKYVRTWIRSEESALVLLQRPGYGTRWRGTMLKRNKKLMMSKQVLLADKRKALSSFNRLIVLGYEINYHVIIAIGNEERGIEITSSACRLVLESEEEETGLEHKYCSFCFEEEEGDKKRQQLACTHMYV
ncbi:hypothetical protein D5086_001851 [Populus alba]|uniref:Uncharacterized protein n=1 Tax=Populus alba TaxID=43335 RepID=A0ACC4CZU3_POPAL